MNSLKVQRLWYQNESKIARIFGKAIPSGQVACNIITQTETCGYQIIFRILHNIRSLQSFIQINLIHNILWKCIYIPGKI